MPGLSDNGKVHMDLDDGLQVGYVPAEGRARGIWNGSEEYGGVKIEPPPDSGQPAGTARAAKL